MNVNVTEEESSASDLYEGSEEEDDDDDEDEENDADHKTKPAGRWLRFQDWSARPIVIRSIMKIDYPDGHADKDIKWSLSRRIV